MVMSQAAVGREMYRLHMVIVWTMSLKAMYGDDDSLHYSSLTSLRLSFRAVHALRQTVGDVYTARLWQDATL